MNISATLNSNRLKREINSFINRDLPRKRSDSIKSLMRRVLQNIIKRNPVESGASRAAWVAALEQLGGTAPAGWQGDSPEAASISKATKQGEAIINDNQTQTDIQAINGVEYITYLEYGASNRAPFRMARQALENINIQDLTTNN